MDFQSSSCRYLYNVLYSHLVFQRFKPSCDVGSPEKVTVAIFPSFKIYAMTSLQLSFQLVTCWQKKCTLALPMPFAALTMIRQERTSMGKGKRFGSPTRFEWSGGDLPEPLQRNNRLTATFDYPSSKLFAPPSYRGLPFLLYPRPNRAPTPDIHQQ